MKQLCPLMSNSEKEVFCTEKCAWYYPDGQISRKCAIFRIVDSIDFVSAQSASFCKEGNEG